MREKSSSDFQSLSCVEPKSQALPLQRTEKDSTAPACSASPITREALPLPALALPTGALHFDYAAALLTSLGAKIERTKNDGTAQVQNHSENSAVAHPAFDWANSGAMAISRNFSGEPILQPFALASVARGTLFALATLADQHQIASIDAPALLSERAAIFGVPKPGRLPTQSCVGSCCLLKTQDAWIAVNLARKDDLALLPAWVGVESFEDPWEALAKKLASLPSQDVIESARLLGLAVARAEPPPEISPPWFRILDAAPGPTPKTNHPLVLDLASLWAGPLCTNLLQQAGARVIKIESLSRPDGTRRGPTEFFDLLNAGKESVALDLQTKTGRAQLAALFERADIVVESSRPRAMTQFGFDVPALVRRRKNLTWLSITGYGRLEPEANWIAFGDDAAVAAGLAIFCADDATVKNMHCNERHKDHRDLRPIFCGDAIADPLTGMHAALAAQASWQTGGSRLLDISLRNVAAHALGFARNVATRARLECETSKDLAANFEKTWRVRIDETSIAVAPPRARKATQRARPLGADTVRVLGEFRIPC